MSDDEKGQAQPFIIDETHFRNLSQQIITTSHDQHINSNNSMLLLNYSTIGRRQINHFLAGCGITSNNIKSTDTSQTKTIREEIAYYIHRVKNHIPFEEFWRTYQFELPSLASLVRWFNI